MKYASIYIFTYMINFTEALALGCYSNPMSGIKMASNGNTGTRLPNRGLYSAKSVMKYYYLSGYLATNLKAFNECRMFAFKVSTYPIIDRHNDIDWVAVA